MLELAAVIVLGILAQWIAWKSKVPAILPLIITGLLVGPVYAYFNEGAQLINPTYDAETNKGLFSGKNLFYFVSLSIGIILFEGGLTLRRKELRGVAPVIINLISIGSLVTFVGGGLTARYVMGLDWSISFLFAGLIIVTGPTVIAPILRNVPLTKNVSTVLKWEGILIDPIGALVAVLVYEFIKSGHENPFTFEAFKTFGLIVVTGFAVGYACAIALYHMIKKELIPHYLLNIFTLAFVVFAFAGSDLLAHESGLLTVVVMGMVLGNKNVPHLNHILDFKESITVLLISVLFILLSANISYEQLSLVMTTEALLLFAIVVFVLRPIGVFLSTIGSDLSIGEKLFISWVGPRGIVAAGVASLFGLTLLQTETLPQALRDQAALLTPLTFLIVMGTVLLNATTARFVARILGVTLKKSDGFLIIGANKAARVIAKYIQGTGKHVVLVDNNEQLIQEAKLEGLEAINENIYQSDLEDRFDLLDMSTLMALTSSVDVNKFACKKFKDNFGEDGSFRLITQKEMKYNELELSPNLLFGKFADYLYLNDVIRDNNTIREFEVTDLESLNTFIDQMTKTSIPLFLKKEDRLEVVNVGRNFSDDVVGATLVYIGECCDD